MIPSFPDSRPIGLSDKPLFDKLFKDLQPEISEFTFTNLFSWQEAYGFKISQKGDFLIIRFLREDNEYFLDPIGRENSKNVIKDCLEKFPNAKFVRLPFSTAVLFNNETAFKAIEDRDNFDYLYRRKDLIELKGKKYDAKRNFIRRFFNLYKPVCRKATPADVEQCIRFHNQWCDDKSCEQDAGLRREKQAILKMLKNCQQLALSGAIIEIDGRIQAFSIGEPLNHTTFVIHAEKANSKFIGIYQAINNFFASLIPENFEFVNREQDLGIDNLRKAKTSYQPASFVKKFTVFKIDKE
ncbi:MAG: phosphatidylglycerol lysyltransferase domain-containing protein [Candidatus Omnitrophota bacterium]